MDVCLAKFGEDFVEGGRFFFFFFNGSNCNCEITDWYFLGENKERRVEVFFLAFVETRISRIVWRFVDNQGKAISEFIDKF